MRPVRNSAAYQDFLQLEEQANPDGTIYVITDQPLSHDSKSTRAWLEGHPRIRHAFIPKGILACPLTLVRPWAGGPAPGPRAGLASLYGPS